MTAEMLAAAAFGRMPPPQNHRTPIMPNRQHCRGCRGGVHSSSQAPDVRQAGRSARKGASTHPQKNSSASILRTAGSAASVSCHTSTFRESARVPVSDTSKTYRMRIPLAVGFSRAMPLCAAPDVAVHGAVPEFIRGTGACIRALRINHQLVVIGIFIEP